MQIDLDTIDVSNLNRQFLFHKEHVGKSKSQVARESALQFNPNVEITAHHDSITRFSTLEGQLIVLHSLVCLSLSAIVLGLVISSPSRWS